MQKLSNTSQLGESIFSIDSTQKITNKEESREYAQEADKTKVHGEIQPLLHQNLSKSKKRKLKLRDKLLRKRSLSVATAGISEPLSKEDNGRHFDYHRPFKTKVTYFPLLALLSKVK